MSNKPESKSAKEKRVVAQWKIKLATDPKWATRGLLAIYKFQTESEKVQGTVTEFNGVGFSGIDGEFLSSLAMQLQQRGTLSTKQMQFLYKKMPRYAKQLYKAAGSPA